MSAKTFPIAIGSNRVLEIQTGSFNFKNNFVLFNVELNRSYEKSHAGTFFSLALCNLHFIAHFYDKRSCTKPPA